jgi:hypothetical protein
MENVSFSDQEKELKKVWQKNRKRAWMYQPGIGRQFCESAGQFLWRYRVERRMLTNQIEEAMADQLGAIIEKKVMKIPNDDFMGVGWRLLKRETESPGNIRFAKQGGRNGRTARFWALAMLPMSRNKNESSFRTN